MLDVLMLFQRRIVGGVETGVNEFPSMAALIDLSNKNLYCGATIIAKRFGLTVAHCVRNKVAQNIGLLVGDHDISTGNNIFIFTLTSGRHKKQLSVIFLNTWLEYELEYSNVF